MRAYSPANRCVFIFICALLFFFVNTGAVSAQTDSISDFVVTWQDDLDGNDVYQIRARGFDADGSQAFSDRTVNSIPDGQQFVPEIAINEVGNFVVVWQDDSDDNDVYQILARGFNADGSQRIADFTVNSDAAGDQLDPAIAMDAVGRFVVVWEDDRDDNGLFQIRARGFNADGTERFADITVNTDAGGQQLDPAIAMDAEGNFVVVWEDDQDDNGVYQIFARGFNADGSERIADFTVNSIAAGEQLDPDVAMDTEGNFVVVWEDDADGNGSYQILGRGFNADGSERIADFTVNSVGDGQQFNPAIAMDMLGNFVVVWQDDNDGNGVYQIFARGFYADGAQRFGDFTVNTIADGQQIRPAIAMDAVGRFVVAWEDDADGNGAYQIRARGFNANGGERFADFTVNVVADGQQINPAIAMVKKTKLFVPLTVKRQ